MSLSRYIGIPLLAAASVALALALIALDAANGGTAGETVYRLAGVSTVV